MEGLTAWLSIGMKRKNTLRPMTGETTGERAVVTSISGSLMTDLATTTNRGKPVLQRLAHRMFSDDPATMAFRARALATVMGGLVAVPLMGIVAILGGDLGAQAMLVAGTALLPMALAVLLAPYAVRGLARGVQAVQSRVTVLLEEHRFAVGLALFCVVAIPGGSTATIIGALVEAGDGPVSIATSIAAVAVSCTFIILGGTVAAITPLHGVFASSSVQLPAQAERHA